MENRISPAVQDYAKAIYALEQRLGAAVSTNALAERLGVTAGYASSMVKKLDAMELVTHVPYKGVKLTEEGQRVALETLRHHRLLERYLRDELNVPWDRVHAEAEVLEHVLSEELEDRIADKLGHPSHDPHGDPIPTRDLEVEEEETRALSDLASGERGVLVRVSDANPEMLRYLTERGIAPGMELEVTGSEPFEGPLRVRFPNGEHALGRELARSMRVGARP